MLKIEKIPGAVAYLNERLAESTSRPSFQQLANEINSKFNLHGKEKVSFMAVKRYLNKELEREIEKKGLTPLISEFRNRMWDLIGETENIIAQAKDTHNIKNVIFALEQQRKNLVSLIKYGEQLQQQVEKSSIQSDKNVKIYILKMTSILPIEYRRKIVEALETETIVWFYS